MRSDSKADCEKVAGGVCGGKVDAVDVGEAGADAVYERAGCDDVEDVEARLNWLERWRWRCEVMRAFS